MRFIRIRSSPAGGRTAGPVGAACWRPGGGQNDSTARRRQSALTAIKTRGRRVYFSDRISGFSPWASSTGCFACAKSLARSTMLELLFPATLRKTAVPRDARHPRRNAPSTWLRSITGVPSCVESE